MPRHAPRGAAGAALGGRSLVLLAALLLLFVANATAGTATRLPMAARLHHCVGFHSISGRPRPLRVPLVPHAIHPAPAHALTGSRPSKTRLQFAIQPAAFKTSVNAVLRLVSSCSLGLLVASKGLLDQASLSTLSRLIFAFFQPALLFTNVAMTLANPAGNQASLVVLPIFAVLQILIGSLYGRGLAKLLRLDLSSDAGKELAVCSAFANSGPLPLLFADAFFRTHPTDPTLYPRAVAYISFYLVAWSPLFWTYGAAILGNVKGQKPYEPPPPKPPANASSSAPQHMDPLAAAEAMASGVRATVQRVTRHPTFQKVVSPPTMGCLLGAIVGATPQLRNLFIGPSAPLACIFDALRTMGSAYLPTVLLVLSGALAQGLKSLDASVLGRMAAIMVSRFAFMPATAFLLVRLGLRAGLIPAGDPLLIFVLLLQASVPCAQNTVVLLTLQKKPEAAASMAKLVSLIYILSIAPMGLLLSVILQYVGL